MEQTAILATALTAAISAFAILIPGQTENYLLPLLPLAVWLASLGQGCASAGFGSGFLKLLGRLPIYPMFGRGLTRLQPAYVEDVAEAIARALRRTEMHAITFECGGPRIYSYEELLKTVAHEASLKPMLIPISLSPAIRKSEIQIFGRAKYKNRNQPDRQNVRARAPP